MNFLPKLNKMTQVQLHKAEKKKKKEKHKKEEVEKSVDSVQNTTLFGSSFIVSFSVFKQYPGRPTTLFKRGSDTSAFLWVFEKNIHLVAHLRMAASELLKAAGNSVEMTFCMNNVRGVA